MADETPTAPGLLTLLAARERLWDTADFPKSQVAPSLDVVTLALARLVEVQQAMLDSFKDFALLSEQRWQEFLVLQARERREHKAVSGRITFGRPVRGVVSFTA